MALDAAKSHKDETPDQIRAALREELAAHGIDDVRPQDIDFLEESITTSPRRAGARLLLRRAKAVIGLVGELRQIAHPQWTATPTGIPSLVSWRDDQQGVEVVLQGVDLRPAHDVLARLLTDLPPATADPEDEDDDGRGCDCWLSYDPASGSSGAVNVHIGKHTIASIYDERADLARELITKCGGQQHAVEIIAKLHGDDVDAAQIKLFLPDRP